MTKHLVRAQMVSEAQQVLICVKYISARRTQTHLVSAYKICERENMGLLQNLQSNSRSLFKTHASRFLPLTHPNTKLKVKIISFIN